MRWEMRKEAQREDRRGNVRLPPGHRGRYRTVFILLRPVFRHRPVTSPPDCAQSGPRSHDTAAGEGRTPWLILSRLLADTERRAQLFRSMEGTYCECCSRARCSPPAVLPRRMGPFLLSGDQKVYLTCLLRGQTTAFSSGDFAQAM